MEPKRHNAVALVPQRAEKTGIHSGLFVAEKLRLSDVWAITSDAPAGLNIPAAAGVMPDDAVKAVMRVKAFLNLGPSASITLARIKPRRVVACGGLIETLSRVAEGWAVISAEIGERNLGSAFVRFARQLLNTWIAEGNYRRVSAVVPDVSSDLRFGQEGRALTGRFKRWVELLGFRYETKLAEADSYGNDLLIFVQFPEREDSNNGL